MALLLSSDADPQRLLQFVQFELLGCLFGPQARKPPIRIAVAGRPTLLGGRGPNGADRLRRGEWRSDTHTQTDRRSEQPELFTPEPFSRWRLVVWFWCGSGPGLACCQPCSYETIQPFREMPLTMTAHAIFPHVDHVHFPADEAFFPICFRLAPCFSSSFAKNVPDALPLLHSGSPRD